MSREIPQISLILTKYESFVNLVKGLGVRNVMLDIIEMNEAWRVSNVPRMCCGLPNFGDKVRRRIKHGRFPELKIRLRTNFLKWRKDSNDKDIHRSLRIK